MMFQVKELLSRIRLGVHQEEKGQTLIEYALIILLISIVVIAVLTALGGDLQAVFQTIRSLFTPSTPTV